MLKYLFTKFVFISWLVLPAQVHVRDEPRHHNVFENEYLRVLDVFLAPKDTTQYHLHNTPSVFIILANCKVSSQFPGGQPQSGANLSGTISYDAMKTERIHRVWNEDTVWFHVMDIELTSKKQKSGINVIQNSALKLLFKEQQVNGYETELKAGARLQLPSSASGYLLVSEEESSINLEASNTTEHRLMRAGHYKWIEPGKSFSVTSNDSKPASLIILQLK